MHSNDETIFKSPLSMNWHKLYNLQSLLEACEMTNNGQHVITVSIFNALWVYNHVIISNDVWQFKTSNTIFLILTQFKYVHIVSAILNHYTLLKHALL